LGDIFSRVLLNKDLIIYYMVIRLCYQLCK
jgi:hypothetical protein